MYKLVATDLDETFLGDGHTVPEPNQRALARMRELGVLFVPSSGRPYRSIMANFADIDQELMADSYVISYNGGFINRYGVDEPITSFQMDPEVAVKLYREGIELGLCQHVNVMDGRTYVTDVIPEEASYMASVDGAEYIDTADYPDLGFLDSPVVKVLYMSTDFDALHRIGDEMAAFCAEHDVEITYSSGRYIEFMPAGINKGAGLATLAAMLNIPIEETIGVGDSANDLEMIKAAGLGVGVANVTPDVRPYCDEVLSVDGVDGAFPELVERFLEPDAR